MKKEIKYVFRRTMVITMVMVVGMLLIPSTIGKIAENQLCIDEETDTLWGLGHIEVTVEEIYGSKENPQYRPLSDVSVKATGISLFVRGREHRDSTNEDGKVLLAGMIAGLYQVNASKDGYVDISSGYKKYRKIEVSPAQTHSVSYTLTEEGSPWDKPKSKSMNRNLQPVIPRLLQILARWIIIH